MRKLVGTLVFSLLAARGYAQKSEGSLSNISFDQNRIEKAASASGRWSMYAADTVGDGANGFGAELGWPDMTLGFVHGTGPTSDIGVKFELLYAFEGSTVDNQLGIGLRVPFRFNVSRTDKLSVLFHVDPGIKLLTYDPMNFGIQAPIGVMFGFRPQPNLSLGFGIDIPFVFYFTGIPKPLIAIPPQFGPTLEYHVDQSFVVGVNARFGALVYFWGDTETDFGTILGDSRTKFAFRLQFVLGYRM
jgi:hypothetical protein